jgi:hypothetical protein
MDRNRHVIPDDNSHFISINVLKGQRWTNSVSVNLDICFVYMTGAYEMPLMLFRVLQVPQITKRLHVLGS